MNQNYSNLKLGIIGGGQLGKMLLQVTSRYNINSKILDPNNDSPCKNLCNEFFLGDLTDHDAVYEFGKKCDLVTYEIEHVNTKALEKLESEGIDIFPRPSTLKIIQDKSMQKKFFLENNIPTAKYRFFKSISDFLEFSKNNDIDFPCIWKKTKFGYDGYGVKKINSLNEITNLPDSEFIIEDYVPFKKELATTVVRNKSGQIEIFPMVEMIFNSNSNQVEYVLCPAQIDKEVVEKAKGVALNLADAFENVGLLTVEMFMTKDNQILVNEVAPRPHNSAHYSIEACISSQFDQHIRSILNLPLGCSKPNSYAVMVNLVGEEGQTGSVSYSGIEKAMQNNNVSIHIYGKSKTKPNRKMGHVTVLDTNLENGLEVAKSIKKIITIKSK